MASTPGYEPGSHWWEASALTTVPSLTPHPQVEVFDTACQNYDPCEWSSCWLNPISAKNLWWKSLESSDPFPYHRNTVTEANSSDLEREREIQAAKNAFGALLPKLEMYIAAVPPSRTQWNWMLVKKLSSPAQLNYLLNSRHRWAGRNSWCRSVEEGWLLLWKLSSPHISSSQLRWGGNVNGTNNFSPSRV